LFVEQRTDLMIRKEMMKYRDIFSYAIYNLDTILDKPNQVSGV
jgi:hypothetical protein